ncbi:MAG: DUF309 domain-containing protein [Sulfurimonas sp.]|nr:DUF309 domain-containing protein [Sulfurimonas sp.]MDQ7060640.1 DUF309 domain-containing protein [Sulfurimonas sp.]
MIEKIQEYILCLDEQRYYDAHEALEAIWFPRRFEDDKEMKLLKGFINASVSFELFKQDKILQSKKVWKNYIKYRPLLYNVESSHSNTYHSIARYVEKIHLKQHY